MHSYVADSRRRPIAALLIVVATSPCAAFSLAPAAPAQRAARAAAEPSQLRAACLPQMQADESASTAETAAAAAAPPPAWFEDGPETAAPAPAAAADAGLPVPSEEAPPLAPPEEEYDPRTVLSLEDLENTKWAVKATPRPDSFMSGGVRDQEFTLLAGGKSVVWGGSAGGFGTGGRWSLNGGLLEVIRSTPLGIATGRDYYMMEAKAGVDDKLQFTLKGIIRSYNAIYPVMVIADFEATRLPGRFVRDVDDDDE